MKEEELKEGLNVKAKDGRRGYLVDWFLSTSGIVGIVAARPADTTVGNNIPIADLEVVA